MAEPEDVRSAAIQLLAKRELMEAELRDALLKKGFASAEVEVVVSDLVRRTIISDSRTLENLMEASTGKRAIGTEKLKAKLMKRGIREEQLDQVLASVSEREPIEARALLESRYPGARREDLAKAGRFLASRGFSEETIASAIESYFPSID